MALRPLRRGAVRHLDPPWCVFWRQASTNCSEATVCVPENRSKAEETHATETSTCSCVTVVVELTTHETQFYQLSEPPFSRAVIQLGEVSSRETVTTLQLFYRWCSSPSYSMWNHRFWAPFLTEQSQCFSRLVQYQEVLMMLMAILHAYTLCCLGSSVRLDDFPARNLNL